MSKAPGKETVTLKQALEITGFSRATFYRRIEEKKITPLPKPPGYKIAPELKFYREDVEKLLQS